MTFLNMKKHVSRNSVGFLFALLSFYLWTNMLYYNFSLIMLYASCIIRYNLIKIEFQATKKVEGSYSRPKQHKDIKILTYSCYVGTRRFVLNYGHDYQFNRNIDSKIGQWITDTLQIDKKKRCRWSAWKWHVYPYKNTSKKEGCNEK